MHASYTATLAVLDALQAEGFLKYSSKPTHALIVRPRAGGRGRARARARSPPPSTPQFSGVTGEGAHNVPKPRRPTDGINAYTVQFIRRCLLDAGLPLRSFLEGT